ncbi:transcription termination/antitermination protein NusG [Rhizobium sp. CNPSo 4062]|uniref:transcription termination/antitermination protein NusG n=1 Tax=Rhizobium sp. CNPSo 4062 TaxID=3021410 RepID=UPI00254C3977|nr:transcription termination/antitermination protein NusG [Rhizobium sp. CNPSo 4062]MDK4704316.1 transcription termination/antitermination protein NusG [Rhizobium sp. CNPSo 4062]
MMMQHDKFDGTLIAASFGERFEDRMRRIKADLLHAATLRAHADSPWFAVRVMSGREIAVKNALDDAGVEALVPMRKGPEYRRRGRVIPSKMIPVMTSYVLVRFMISDEAFLGIQGIEHVIGILGGCINPRRVPNSEVNRFKALADDGSLDWERQTVVFKIGETVRVASGPFASLCGKIVSCRDDGRGDAVIEIDIFGRTTPTLMPLAILEKV